MASKVKEIVETAPAIEELTPDGVEVIEERPLTADVTVESKTGDSKTRMYLLSGLTKDSSTGLAELTALVAAAGSKVEKTEDLGVKRLAFPINKNRELALVSVFFNADGIIVKKLDSELKHAEIIERYLLTTWRAGLEAPKRRQVERQKLETRNYV